MAAPIVAAMYALGRQHRSDQLRLVRTAPGALNDVTSGSNGSLRRRLPLHRASPATTARPGSARRSAPPRSDSRVIAIRLSIWMNGSPRTCSARAAGRPFQRGLSALTGVAQPTIARIERGTDNPRIGTVERLFAACGETIEALPRTGVGIDRSEIRALLALSPHNERRRWLTRLARWNASTTPAGSGDMAFDPIGALQVLQRHEVRFVVIGGVAARLWGSPTMTNDVDICYDRDPRNLERLAAALQESTLASRGVHDDVPFRAGRHDARQGPELHLRRRASARSTCVACPRGSGLRQPCRQCNDIRPRRRRTRPRVRSTTSSG